MHSCSNQQVDWTSGLGEIIRCWLTELPLKSAGSVSWRKNVKGITMRQEFWENDRIRDLVPSQEFRPHYDITGKPMEFVWKFYVEKRRSKSSNAPRIYWKWKEYNRPSFRTASFSCPMDHDVV